MIERGKGLPRAIQMVADRQRHTFNGNGEVRQIKTLRGYRRTGSIEVIGVYTLVQEHTIANGSTRKRYILTQDTLTAQPVKGVIVENGEVVEAVGFGDSLSVNQRKRIKDEFFSQFNECESFYDVKKEDLS